MITVAVQKIRSKNLKCKNRSKEVSREVESLDSRGNAHSLQLIVRSLQEQEWRSWASPAWRSLSSCGKQSLSESWAEEIRAPPSVTAAKLYIDRIEAWKEVEVELNLKLKWKFKNWYEMRNELKQKQRSSRSTVRHMARPKALIWRRMYRRASGYI